MRHLVVTLTLALLFTWSGATVAADTPLVTVQTAVGKVMAIIDDPALQNEANRPEQVQRISVIVDAVFDYPTIARQALGKNWTRITETEQQEFTVLFSKFLGDVYITKITSFPGSKVEYGKEIALSDKVTEVQTTVNTQDLSVPISYRLTSRDGAWKVYDVIVEGVSLLNNYRSQFHSILSKKPMEYLLVQLRAKVKENKG